MCRMMRINPLNEEDLKRQLQLTSLGLKGDQQE